MNSIQHEWLCVHEHEFHVTLGIFPAQIKLIFPSNGDHNADKTWTLVCRYEYKYIYLMVK